MQRSKAWGNCFSFGMTSLAKCSDNAAAAVCIYFAVEVKVGRVASLSAGDGTSTTELQPGVGEQGADVGVGESHRVLLSMVQQMYLH